MMMVFKRKEVLIGALILLIGVAAFINFNYAGDTTGDGTQTVSAPTQQEEQTQAQAEDEQQSQQTRKMGEAQYVSSSTDENAYFAEARMNRENSRSKAIEMLNGIINNTNIDAESRQKAQEDIMKYASLTDQEAACENLIKAKGFADAVVFVNEPAANVTVKSEGLSTTDVAKIQEIVNAQTGIEIKNIKIVEVK